ncbi:hypothetical protein [Cryobacterium sp. Y11]|uniref:hypothetical protein n=1 Tax=Cryobacterium sp. Y11 TaxID=2045016 RepID=UPI000CE5427B|nr:hypothetical protein [Cryobacterium sp. Y11]
MAGKYGADVEQLRQLAHSMSTASDRLERDRLTVGHQIKISAWVGPFAATFKAQWESEHSLHVASVARVLEENATQLRKNADAQEAASAADGSTFGRIVESAESADVGRIIADLIGGGRPDEAIKKLLDLLGGSLTLLDIATIAREMSNLPTTTLLQKFLGPIALVLEGNEIVGLVKSGDVGGALGHLGSGVASLTSYVMAFTPGAAHAAGTAGLTAGLQRLSPLVLGISALVTFVDMTIPRTQAEQNETYEMGARHLFGRNVDVDNLSQEQASQMSRRYEGVWGAMTMISDKMDTTAEELFSSNRGK